MLLVQVIQQLVEEWKAKKSSGSDSIPSADIENIYSTGVTERHSDEEDNEEEDANTLQTADGPRQFISHVPVPSQQDIEEALVRRKKMELLQKYTSDSLRAEAEEAKKLLGM